MDPILMAFVCVFAGIGLLTSLLVTVAVIYALCEDRRVKRLYWGHGR